jgi:hypothetical protein
MKNDTGGDKIVLEEPAKAGIVSPISDGINPQSTSGKDSPVGNLGRQAEPTADVAGRIDLAIKRNPQEGRETAVEKIRRERDALIRLQE